jgi:TusA-related sulfurtransferase
VEGAPSTDDVGAAGEVVAFLDASGMDADVLFATIARVLSGMPDAAVLTVFTDDPAAQARADEWCARHGVELLATINQDGGTTLALRRGVASVDHPGTNPRPP